MRVRIVRWVAAGARHGGASWQGLRPLDQGDLVVSEAVELVDELVDLAVVFVIANPALFGVKQSPIWSFHLQPTVSIISPTGPPNQDFLN